MVALRKGSTVLARKKKIKHSELHTGPRRNEVGENSHGWTGGWAEVTNRFLMCCREPRHLNCPFTMMARRLHSASHSSMLRNGRKEKRSGQKPLSIQ